MCELNGQLTITYEDGRGYIKGRIGKDSFYIPPKGGARMARLAKAREGQVVSAATKQGMLIRIDGVYENRRHRY
jgi:hypothetical protein